MILPPLGSLWIPRNNGIAWSQPFGPGTTVFPQQNDGQLMTTVFPGYPPFAEAGEALWRAGCGHGFDTIQVWRDFDSTTGKSVAILACPMCSFIINYIEPYEEINNPLAYPILLA